MSTPLWRDRGGYRAGPFFAAEHEDFKTKGGAIQRGPRCVSHSLSLLTLGLAPPAAFQTDKDEGRDSGINTQCPVSWSAALKRYGRKLAYCSTDLRTLGHFFTELCELNDIFTLSYYVGNFMAEPDPETGWICGSHIVVMVGPRIYNSTDGSSIDVRTEEGRARYGDCFVKRIFRVVPADYPSEL